MLQKSAPKTQKKKVSEKVSSKPKTKELPLKSEHNHNHQKQKPSTLLPFLVLLIPFAGFVGYYIADQKSQVEIYRLRKMYEKELGSRVEKKSQDSPIQTTPVAETSMLLDSVSQMDMAFVGNYSSTKDSGIGSHLYLTVSGDYTCGLEYGTLSSPLYKQGTCEVMGDTLTINFIDGEQMVLKKDGGSLVGVNYNTRIYGEGLSLSKID